MVKHVVMYKLKDRTEENRQNLVNKFLSMKGKIDILKSIESGADFLNDDRSYDVVLICEFDSMDDFKIYQTHPVHLPVKEYVKSVVERAHSIDYYC